MENEEIKNCPFCQSAMKQEDGDMIHPESWCILSGYAWPIQNARTWNKRTSPACKTCESWQAKQRREYGQCSSDKVRRDMGSIIFPGPDFGCIHHSTHKEQ